MQVDGKTLSFDKSLWVQYGGVDVEEREGLRRVTGREEEAFLKVFNHFGRLLKLFTFEDGRWMDADTGGAPLPFDESQAGRLSVGTEATAPAAAAWKSSAGKAPASSGADKQARTRAGKATAAGAGRGGKTAPPRAPDAGHSGAKGGKARKAPPGPKAR